MLTLVLLTFAFLFSLIVALEIILRVFFPQNIIRTHVNGKMLTTYDEQTGFVCNPGAHVLVKGPQFSVEYKINEEGLRDEFLYNNHRSVIRILLIGDSFAFGAANEYDKTFSVIFERQLKQNGYDVDVIKAGIPFRNTDGDVLYLENIVPKYNPDFVIYTFLPNNLFVNMPITEDHISQKQKKRSKEDIIGMNNKFNSLHVMTLLKRIIISNDFFYTLIYARTVRGQYFSTRPSFKVNNQIDLTKSLLLRMAGFCQAKNIRFLVLSIPQQFQVISKARNYEYLNMDVNLIDKIFSRFAHEMNFGWIPTLPKVADMYYSTGKNNYFRLDGHLNNDGNYLIGKYLATHFLDNELSSEAGKVKSS
jgi:hypothetical protein